MKEILAFSNIFNSENYELYLSRINEIPKNLLIDVSTHLLSFYQADSFVSDHKELLSKWFCSKNSKLANEINDKINDYIKKTNREIGIINAKTSLALFETVLSSKNNPPTISNEDFEILLFKIYLALNEKLNIKSDSVIASVKDDVKYPKLICLAIANSLPTFDILNYNISSVFITQVIKTIYFLEFLASRAETKQLLTDFYIKFEVQDYKEFLNKLLPISYSVISSNNTGKFDIIVNVEEDSSVDVSFLDNLIINQIEPGEDVDYINIRSNPLIKISENIYRIIFPLFVFEKNFNGLYFLLKEINDGYEKNERINLRQLVTFDFSEKHMLYSLIERTFAKRYLKFTGEQMITPGAPDYYMRNGNKIFIFESKDILINASVKESYDFEKYESILKDKLYFHKDKKKESAKAVKQLACFAETIINGNFKEDSNYKPKSAKIYPIILLHNRQLDILGLNKLINIWFQTELDSINKALNVKNIRMPTILSIDTLILIHERLLKGDFKLENLLDEYQNYINDDKLKKRTFINEEQLHAEIQNQLVSFNMYLENKYGWKIPELFKEKGISILME
jgi:hypothetical protein